MIVPNSFIICYSPWQLSLLIILFPFFLFIYLFIFPCTAWTFPFLAFGHCSFSCHFLRLWIIPFFDFYYYVVGPYISSIDHILILIEPSWSASCLAPSVSLYSEHISLFQTFDFISHYSSHTFQTVKRRALYMDTNFKR